MKRILKAFYMTFGMFCAVPLPVHFWDESCAGLMMPCFPVLGIIIGAIWRGVAELFVFSEIHIMLASAALTVVLLFTAGLIHLDGFMDACDAVLSRRALEEKVRILKDPHTGSFAVIMLAALFLVQFAAVYALLDNGKSLSPLFVIPAISRSCSAMSMLSLKPAPHSGYANMFKPRAAAAHRAFVAIIAICMLLLAYLSSALSGLVVTVAVVAGFAASMAAMYRVFKGVSGDLAGFSLVVGELCGLIALAAV